MSDDQPDRRRTGGSTHGAPRRADPRRDGRDWQPRGRGPAQGASTRRPDRAPSKQGAFKQASASGQRSTRTPEPPVPDDVTGRELDRHVRGELGTLSKDNATQVARHLVMTFSLLDTDPAAALEHAMAAQRRAGRVGLVREAAGIAAYRAGQFDQALRELRTARRLTGSNEHLPVMADCERGLGRPERALALASGPEAKQLDRAGQLELLMVAAGARQDLGQLEAAVVMLQVPELTRPDAVGHARLASAYADALEAAGRPDEAVEWLRRAAAADPDGETGAAERLGLDDDEITDLLDEDRDDDLEG